jgi:hypothetical protein
MVKKVCVSALQAARDQPAALLIYASDAGNKRRERYCDFMEPTDTAAVGAHAAQVNMHSNCLLAVLCGIGSNDRAEDLQYP